MSRLTGYIPGDHLAECDRCGFEYRNSQLFTEYTGLRVCRKCYDKEPVYPDPGIDKISVLNPRPEQETTSNNTTWTETYIGPNLWDDPWMADDKTGLWHDSELSQDHVRYNQYSRKLNGSEEYITVSGLTIGKEYRFKLSAWHDTRRTIVYIINGGSGSYSDIFDYTKLQDWVDCEVYFTALSESVTIQFLTGGSVAGTSFVSYIDGLYIQEYSVTYHTLSNGDILNNVAAPDNIVNDNTITPDPAEVPYWDDTNIFPDPNMSLSNDHLWGTVSIVGTVATSISTDYVLSGDYSRKAIYSVPPLTSAAIYIECPVLEDDETYKLTVNGYFTATQLRSVVSVGSFGLSVSNIFPQGAQPLNQWISDDVEFTYLSSMASKKIYIGTTNESTETVYYDSIELNKQITKTTPF